MQFDATLSWKNHSLSLSFLVDSGSDENFAKKTLASLSGIPTETLNLTLDANTLDGKLLACVTHQTEPLHLTLTGNHHENIQFHLISCPHSPLVLGMPWLMKHNPNVHWSGVE